MMLPGVTKLGRSRASAGRSPHVGVLLKTSLSLQVSKPSDDPSFQPSSHPCWCRMGQKQADPTKPCPSCRFVGKVDDGCPKPLCLGWLMQRWLTETVSLIAVMCYYYWPSSFPPHVVYICLLNKPSVPRRQTSFLSFLECQPQNLAPDCPAPSPWRLSPPVLPHSLVCYISSLWPFAFS